MKTIVTILFLLIAFTSVSNAQPALTDDDWQKLIQSLTNEDWQKADDLSNAFLKKIPKEKINEDDACILRYMYILSESGLMNMRKLTQEQAFAHVKDFAGLNIILPGHPVTLKNAFNSMQMVNNKAD